MGLSAKNFLGYCSITDGTTQTNIPTIRQNPRDPLNNLYPGMINKAGAPSVVVAGRKTPSVGFETLLKSSWASAALMTSLIVSADANFDANPYSVLLNDGTTSLANSNKIFAGCRGAALILGSSGSGGGIYFSMAFLAQTGAGSTSFAGYTEDAGSLIDVSQIDFGGSATADLVDAWRLTILRGAAYDMYFNPGSLDPSGVSSGMIGGTLELIQSPRFTVTPSSTFTARIGGSIGSPLLTATANVNFDELIYDREVGQGRLRRLYTLFNSSTGAIPIGFA